MTMYSKKQIRYALRCSNGDTKAAAKLLGCSLSTVYRLMDKPEPKINQVRRLETIAACENHTLKEAGVILNITRQAVQQRVIEYSIDRQNHPHSLRNKIESDPVLSGLNLNYLDLARLGFGSPSSRFPGESFATRCRHRLIYALARDGWSDSDIADRCGVMRGYSMKVYNRRRK